MCVALSVAPQLKQGLEDLLDEAQHKMSLGKEVKRGKVRGEGPEE